jgi:hypothetical protein
MHQCQFFNSKNGVVVLPACRACREQYSTTILFQRLMNLESESEMLRDGHTRFWLANPTATSLLNSSAGSGWQLQMACSVQYLHVFTVLCTQLELSLEWRWQVHISAHWTEASAGNVA